MGTADILLADYTVGDFVDWYGKNYGDLREIDFGDSDEPLSARKIESFRRKITAACDGRGEYIADGFLLEEIPKRKDWKPWQTYALTGVMGNSGGELLHLMANPVVVEGWTDGMKFQRLKQCVADSSFYEVSGIRHLRFDTADPRLMILEKMVAPFRTERIRKHRESLAAK